ncbi:NfeD family protein [Dactylosporangium sp. NPDC050688]|uniref:NfeD family protein n=1 Tax=Dactylosporangium sp. NPDC050688 TaxID=3157217 RepID=UPI00340EE705
MDVVFLILGGLGVLVLAVSLLVGDLLHFDVDHPDAVGVFSLPAIAGFVGAFGFGGAIVSALGVPGGTVVAALGGLAAAVPTAWLATRLARMAMNMRTDATPTQQDMVGTTGVVVTPITANGFGEVRISLGGQPMKLSARADRPIALGTRILVVEATSSTSVIVEETPF